jgi:hypothetical protein
MRWAETNRIAFIEFILAQTPLLPLGIGRDRELDKDWEGLVRIQKKKVRRIAFQFSLTPHS